MTPTSDWRRGWRVLVAAFMAMAVGWNFALIIAGVFLKPMQAEYGWSRTELSFGPLAGFLAAFMLPLAGWLIERVGARRVALTGLVLLAAAFFLFAAMPASRYYYYALLVFFSAAGAMTSSASLSRPIAAKFRRNLGLAIGVMMSGASLGVVLAMPGLSWVVAQYGLRAGFLALGASTLIVGLPLMIAWFREDAAPLPSATRPVGDFGRVLRDANFWKLTLASAVAALPIGGYIGHLIPILTDRGLPSMSAAWLGSVFGAAVAVGRILSGALLDRFHPARATAVVLVIAAAGSAMLFGAAGTAGSAGVLVVSVVMIGLAQGAEGDYILFFGMRLFGFAVYARVVSLLALTIMLGMAAGGLAFAQVYDHVGSYTPVLLVATGCYVLAALGFLSLRIAARESGSVLRDA